MTLMRTRSSRRRGMTLVEVIIAGGISAVIGMAAITILVMSSRMASDNALYAKVNAEARLLSDMLSRDIREAVSLEPTLTDGSDTYTMSDTTLILRVPSVDNTGTPTDIENDHDFIVYHSALDKAIYRTIIPGADSSRTRESKLLGKSDDPRIAFTGSYSAQPDALGTYLVHYEFRSERTRANGPSTKNVIMAVSGAVFLRNKG